MADWGSVRHLALDTETTGVDVETDRIVTASAAVVEAGSVSYQRSWLLAVEVDIPEAATAVHGITTEKARADGVPVTEGIPEIAGAVQYALRTGMPVVAYNAPFDLTILDRELRRLWGGGLADFCDCDVRPVIDPLCIDRAVDRYRPGKRHLGAVCEAYGVRLSGDAHNAAADAAAAAGLAACMYERTRLPHDDLFRIFADRKFPDRLVRDWAGLGMLSADQLHRRQVVWYADQAESMRQYFRREANQKRAEADRADPGSEDRVVALHDAADLDRRADGVCSDWPIVAVPGASDG